MSQGVEDQCRIQLQYFDPLRSFESTTSRCRYHDHRLMYIETGLLVSAKVTFLERQIAVSALLNAWSDGARNLRQRHTPEAGLFAEGGDVVRIDVGAGERGQRARFSLALRESLDHSPQATPRTAK
jgi:hypothetical protein